ncbi:MAG: PfkB family carbohydrate kinase [Thaumarchaeota archaeon]|nr:PfkB family carbohydrate kinase [Nitrososphaerota archaeon]MCL5317061.1 PfkB family carbohydrate kinase [Nitrososphaerota archaeon]
MRITVVGYLVIDEVVSGKIRTTTLGGPPSYAGLAARKLGAEDVSLFTKFGADFPDDYLLWLSWNQLKINRYARSTSHLTTRFRIVQKPDGRELYLEARCEDLKADGELPEGDVAVVSPVAGEVDFALLNHIRKQFKTVYLDPQGFIRRFEQDGRCYLINMDRRTLKYADIVKMDGEEALMMTGLRDPVQALEEVRRSGVEVVIYTKGAEGALLRCSKGLFRIPVVRQLDVLDTTGAGDIFAGAFATTYLEGGDPVWSGCVAVAAASAGLDKVGLSKVAGIDAVAGLAEETAKKVEQMKDGNV